MRTIIVLLLLFSSLVYAEYGPSKITLERTWTIENGNSEQYELTGAVAINNSNQRVVSLFIEDGATYEIDEQGVIWLNYLGDSPNVTAVVIMEIDYETNITSDPQLPGSGISSTELTEPSNEMAAIAGNLSRKNSTLKTITNLVNYVHGFIEYDESYWGKQINAQQIFNERKGVCVQYTHLFISFARSLGLDTRYVVGYVYTDDWQPHAWAEVYVPEYGWLAVDPTFPQAGNLEGSHVAINYGDDQLSVYDQLLSKNSYINLLVNDSLDFISRSNKTLDISMEADYESYLLKTIIVNNRPDYLFGTYSVAVPEAFGTSPTPEIILLSPGDMLMRYQGLNRSLFDNARSIQFSVSFNDNKIVKTVELDKSASCLPFLLIFFLLISRIHGVKSCQRST